MYTLEPYSFGDNSSWKLKCNDTHFASNGLTLAKCLGNGLLRPAGVCMEKGCASETVAMYTEFGTTCPDQMQEGDTCTIRCDPDNADILENAGFWTCIRAQLWGTPTCINREAKYWVVSWVLPKIIGGFDFRGLLAWTANISNATIAEFRTNLTRSLADTLVNVESTHFDEVEVFQLYESMDEFDEETGQILSWDREHVFSVNYHLTVWDVNTLEINLDALRDIVVVGSDSLAMFESSMLARANITLLETYPTNNPITYNDTVLAPDSELSSRASPHRLDSRLVLVLLIVPTLSHLLSGPGREGQG